MKPFAIAFLALALGACAAGPVAETEVPMARPAALVQAIPDSVIGRTAGQLTGLFGAPALQLSEGTARKLQFAGPLCVLDAYLYPPAAGGEPAVTHVDARRPTGEDFDRASCVAALRARAATR